MPKILSFQRVINKKNYGGILFFSLPKHEFKIPHVFYTYSVSQFRLYIFNSLSVKIVPPKK